MSLCLVDVVETHRALQSCTQEGALARWFHDHGRAKGVDLGDSIGCGDKNAARHRQSLLHGEVMKLAFVIQQIDGFFRR